MKKQVKSNELRIGNYVSFRLDDVNDPTKVSISDIGVIDDGCEAFAIPVTYDWLEKFGFKSEFKTVKSKTIEYSNSDINGYTFKIDISYQSLDVFEIWTYIEDDRGDLDSDIHDMTTTATKFEHIKYVHQIQNIYYALTGEELEIKSDKK